MKATVSLCVFLVAAVLAMGDGASYAADNRQSWRGKVDGHRIYFICSGNESRIKQLLAYSQPTLIDVHSLFVPLYS